MTLPKNNLAINKLLLLSILAISCTQVTSKKSSSKPDCYYVTESWKKMKGKKTSVSSTDAKACCYYLGSKTGRITTQTSGIPGVNCTSTGNVTEIIWYDQSLNDSIPMELGKLTNLEYL